MKQSGQAVLPWKMLTFLERRLCQEKDQVTQRKGHEIGQCGLVMSSKLIWTQFRPSSCLPSSASRHIRNSTPAPTALHISSLPSSLSRVHLSIHLPVLATRSHLVAQQHDDHVLLGVLMDLCQPSLETRRKHRMVRQSKAVKKGREIRECRGRRLWQRGGTGVAQWWQMRWMDPRRTGWRKTRDSFILVSLSSLRSPLSI